MSDHPLYASDSDESISEHVRRGNKNTNGINVPNNLNSSLQMSPIPLASEGVSSHQPRVSLFDDDEHSISPVRPQPQFFGRGGGAQNDKSGGGGLNLFGSSPNTSSSSSQRQNMFGGASEHNTHYNKGPHSVVVPGLTHPLPPLAPPKPPSTGSNLKVTEAGNNSDNRHDIDSKSDEISDAGDEDVSDASDDSEQGLTFADGRVGNATTGGRACTPPLGSSSRQTGSGSAEIDSAGSPMLPKLVVSENRLGRDQNDTTSSTNTNSHDLSADSLSSQNQHVIVKEADVRELVKQIQIVTANNEKMNKSLLLVCEDNSRMVDLVAKMTGETGNEAEFAKKFSPQTSLLRVLIDEDMNTSWFSSGFGSSSSRKEKERNMNMRIEKLTELCEGIQTEYVEYRRTHTVTMEEMTSLLDALKVAHTTLHHHATEFSNAAAQKREIKLHIMSSTDDSGLDSVLRNSAANENGQHGNANNFNIEWGKEGHYVGSHQIRGYRPGNNGSPDANVSAAKITEKDSQLMQANETIESFRAQVEKFESQRQAFQAEIATLKTDLETASVECEAYLSKATDDAMLIEELERAIAELKDANIALEKKFQDQEAIVEALNEQNQQWSSQTKNANVRQLMILHEEEMEQVKSGYETQLSALRQEIGRSSTGGHMSDDESVQGTADALNRQIEQLSQEINGARRELREKEGELSETRLQLHNAEAQLRTVLSAPQNTDQKRCDSSLDEDAADKLNQLEMELEQAKLEAAAAVDTAVESQTKEKNLKQELESARIMLCEALEEQKNQQEQAETERSELRELRLRFDRLQQEAYTAFKERSEAVLERTDLQSQVSSNRERLAEMESFIANVNEAMKERQILSSKELERTQQQLQNTENQLNEANETIAALRHEIDAVDQNEVARERESFSKETTLLRQQLENMQRQQQEWRDTVAGLEQEREEYETERIKLVEERNTAEEAKEHIEEMLTTQIRELTEQVHAAHEANAQLGEELSKMKRTAGTGDNQSYDGSASDESRTATTEAAETNKSKAQQKQKGFFDCMEEVSDAMEDMFPTKQTVESKAEAEVAKLQQQNQTLHAEINRLQQKIDRTASDSLSSDEGEDTKEMRKRFIELEEKLQIMTEEHTVMTDMLTTTTEENEMLKQMLTEAEARLEALKEEHVAVPSVEPLQLAIEEKEATITTITEMLTQKTAAYETLTDTLAETEDRVKTLAEHREALQKSLTAKEEEIDTVTNTLATAQQTISNLEEKNNQLEASLAETNQLLEERSAENVSFANLLAELKSNAGGITEVVEELSSENARLKQSLLDKEKQLESSVREGQLLKNELEHKLDAHKSELDQKEVSTTNMSDMLTEANAKITDLEANLVSMEAKINMMTEEHAVMTEMLTTTTEENEEYKQALAERSMGEQQKSTKLHQQLEEARAAVKATCEENEHLSARLATMENENRHRDESFETKIAEIETLTQMLTEKEEELLLERQKNEDYQRELQGAMEASSQYTEKDTALRTELVSRLEATEETLSAKTKEVSALTGELQNMADTLAEKTAEIEALTEMLTEKEMAAEEMTTTHNRTQHELEMLQERYESMSAIKTETKNGA